MLLTKNLSDTDYAITGIGNLDWKISVFSLCSAIRIISYDAKQQSLYLLLDYDWISNILIDLYLFDYYWATHSNAQDLLVALCLGVTTPWGSCGTL